MECLPVFDSRIDSDAWYQWASKIPVHSEWYLLEFNPASMDVDLSQYLGKAESVYQSFSSTEKNYTSTAWQQFYKILEHSDHLKALTDHLTGFWLEYDYSCQNQIPDPSFFFQYRDGLSADRKLMNLKRVTERLEGYDLAGDAVALVDAEASIDLVGLWLGRHTQAIRLITSDVDLPTINSCLDRIVTHSVGACVVDEMCEWKSMFKYTKLAVDYANNRFLMPVGIECVHAFDWHLVIEKLKGLSLLSLPQYEFFLRMIKGDFNWRIQDTDQEFCMSLNHIKLVFTQQGKMSVKLYADFRVEC